jgi:hypothetical protein
VVIDSLKSAIKRTWKTLFSVNHAYFIGEPLRRVLRKLVWPHPELYRVFGAIDGRTLPAADSFKVWVAGFPRSGNTYAIVVVESAFGLEGKVSPQLHVPPQAITSINHGIKGFLLIRNPTDACISWATYNRYSLKHCLNLYIDFHTVMLPYASRVNIIEFESLVSDLDSLTKFMSTTLDLPILNERMNQQEIIAKIDLLTKDAKGIVDENKVSRPSQERKSRRDFLLNEIRTNNSLQKKFLKCEDIYRQFHALKSL